MAFESALEMACICHEYGGTVSKLLGIIFVYSVFIGFQLLSRTISCLA